MIKISRWSSQVSYPFRKAQQNLSTAQPSCDLAQPDTDLYIPHHRALATMSFVFKEDLSAPGLPVVAFSGRGSLLNLSLDTLYISFSPPGDQTKIAYTQSFGSSREVDELGLDQAGQVL